MEISTLIQTTPEQLTGVILSEIDKKLNELKKDFQLKEQREYLTRNETAKLLSITLSTLHSWTKQGKIPALHLGGRVYYKRHDIENAFTPLNNKNI